jgi:hypothetical protein
VDYALESSGELIIDTESATFYNSLCCRWGGVCTLNSDVDCADWFLFVFSSPNCLKGNMDTT